MDTKEAKERKIEAQKAIKAILNTFTTVTGLSVTDISINVVLQDFEKGYSVIKDLSIEARI